jgi:hypothetical protein
MESNKISPTDIALGIQMTAQKLRELPSLKGKKDDEIKRWVLSTFGWTYSRRTDQWEKEGRQINPYGTLEEILLKMNTVSTKNERKVELE